MIGTILWLVGVAAVAFYLGRRKARREFMDL